MYNAAIFSISCKTNLKNFVLLCGSRAYYQILNELSTMCSTTFFLLSGSTHSKTFVKPVFSKLNYVIGICVTLCGNVEKCFERHWISRNFECPPTSPHPEWRSTITMMYVGEHLIPYTLQNMWHQSLANHVGRPDPTASKFKGTRHRAFDKVLFVLPAAKLNGITSNVTANESLRAQETTIRQRKNQALKTNFNVSRDTRKPILNGDNT